MLEEKVLVRNYVRDVWDPNYNVAYHVVHVIHVLWSASKSHFSGHYD